MYVVEVNDDIETSGLVEVRLGGEVEWTRHCVGSNPMPPWATIRAWVDPADMVPVLAEEAAFGHDDGTGVHLMPGTPRIGDLARLDGQLVPIPPDAPWATTYSGDVARLEEGTVTAQFSWDVAGTIGGEPFAVRRPGTQYGDEFYVEGWASDAGGGLVTHKHRCGEARFRVGPDVAPGVAAGLLGVLGMAAEGEWISVSAGTQLYWEDGTGAGLVSRDHSFNSEHLRGDELRCVDVDIAPAPRGLTANKVSLCAQAGDWVTP